jgi:hypothetical protein
VSVSDQKVFRKMTRGGKAVSQPAIATRGRQSCPTPSGSASAVGQVMSLMGQRAYVFVRLLRVIGRLRIACP